jgi:hypothetical protein
MKYDLSNQAEAGKALNYLLELSQKGAMAEVKKVSPKRSLKQNNYLHLLLGAYGIFAGYTIEEAKKLYKEMNYEVYAYSKKGHLFWRSSTELTTEEMAKTIDKFRQIAADQGCDLPLATDQNWLREIENEIERSKYYL